MLTALEEKWSVTPGGRYADELPSWHGLLKLLGVAPVVNNDLAGDARAIALSSETLDEDGPAINSEDRGDQGATAPMQTAAVFD